MHLFFWLVDFYPCFFLPLCDLLKDFMQIRSENLFLNLRNIHFHGSTQTTTYILETSIETVLVVEKRETKLVSIP